MALASLSCVLESSEQTYPCGPDADTLNKVKRKEAQTFFFPARQSKECFGYKQRIERPAVAKIVSEGLFVKMKNKVFVVICFLSPF